MKKTLIKTAIVSFISVIAVALATAGVVSLTAPKKMAEFCDGIGLKKASVYYYRSDYERDRDADKLVALIDAADFADDDKTLAEYCTKFVFSSEFNAYCEKRDAEKSSSSKISSYDYYCYLAVTSAYAIGNYDTSAETAVKKTDMYDKNCPLEVAINTAVSESNREYAAKIKDNYDKYGAGIEDYGLLDGDLEKLNALLADE